MEELTLAVGDIIVGIDIGTSKVSLIIGEVNNFNQVEILCSTNQACNGIKKGKIINEDEVNKLCICNNTRKICNNSSKQCYKRN